MTNMTNQEEEKMTFRATNLEENTFLISRKPVLQNYIDQNQNMKKHLLIIRLNKGSDLFTHIFYY